MKSLSTRKLVLTAMKKAEDSDRIIIRLFNPTEETVTGEIKTVFKNAKIVNLNEGDAKDFDLSAISVAPHKIVTIEVEKA